MRAQILTVAASIALLLAACTSATDDMTASAPTSTEADATSTSATPSTTVPPATQAPATTTTMAPTTTAPITTTTTIIYRPDPPLTLYPAGSLPGSDGAAGSGCSPGAGPLPNGVWFGLAVGIEPDRIEFDLSCIYFGEIAYSEGAADGEEVNNDFYIRNQNPALRSVPLVDPPVWTLGQFDGSGELFEVDYIDWPVPGPTYTQCPGEWCTVWLYVNDGIVTDIVEQYIP